MMAAENDGGSSSDKTCSFAVLMMSLFQEPTTGGLHFVV
jgi:hypothetical protein